MLRTCYKLNGIILGTKLENNYQPLFLRMKFFEYDLGLKNWFDRLSEISINGHKWEGCGVFSRQPKGNPLWEGASCSEVALQRNYHSKIGTQIFVCFFN